LKHYNAIKKQRQLSETACGWQCIVENRGKLNAPCLAQQPKCVVQNSTCGPIGICQCVSGYASRDNITCRQYLRTYRDHTLKHRTSCFVHLCFLCDGNNYYDSTSIRRPFDCLWKVTKVSDLFFDLGCRAYKLHSGGRTVVTSSSNGRGMVQWCGLRPSVLGQDRAETKAI